MADEKTNAPDKSAAGKAAQKPLDPLRNVPRVAAPAEPEGDKTPEGRLILRDAYGKAFTVSSPQTGGLRTYLDEEEYPPVEPEAAPPPLRTVPPQAAAGAASAFAPRPAGPPAREAPVLQTSAPAAQEHAAAAAGVPSFSATQATAAAPPPKRPAPAAPVTGPLSPAAQAVVDATLAHFAAPPAGAPGEGAKGKP